MAILHSRFRTVYYSLPSADGCLGSVYSFHTDRRLNHKFTVYKGLLQEEMKKRLGDHS